ncbi:unnamed protein product [Symbiodinium natans]|uniref:Uncharacterized protein n=1 Tax=Symbiodinium natans TaxID=878477 RepID=A0A812LF26_9DINO|nr:unnamed protein product [Symbiodinium natans]
MTGHVHHPWHQLAILDRRLEGERVTRLHWAVSHAARSLLVPASRSPRSSSDGQWTGDDGAKLLTSSSAQLLVSFPASCLDSGDHAWHETSAHMGSRSRTRLRYGCRMLNSAASGAAGS